MIEYLIIYGIAFGILSSIAVGKKNRDQIAWFFVGLIFGIFGFIAALIVDTIQPTSEPSPAIDEFNLSNLTKKCPDCAETIKLEARVCRFCQHRFTDDQLNQTITQAKNEYEAKKQTVQAVLSNSHWECPKCHTVSRIDLPYCHICQYSRDKALSELRS